MVSSLKCNVNNTEDMRLAVQPRLERRTLGYPSVTSTHPQSCRSKEGQFARHGAAVAQTHNPTITPPSVRCGAELDQGVPINARAVAAKTPGVQDSQEP
jgi:hypothetical protein